MPSKHQRPEHASHLFRLEHQKEFQVDNGLSFRTGLDNSDTILCAWKPRKGSKSETMTIPQKYIDFAKDNLARVAAVKNDIKNEYEAEDGDGET